jgi:nucleoside-diphosphate-sugar epimerase
MVRSQDSSASLSDAGGEPVIADALDAASVSAAVAKVRPAVIINELTSLPQHYTATEMKAAAERDARVRLEGNKNLIAAARQAGVRRVMVQSTGFWYAPGQGLADETESFAVDATPGIAVGSQRYAELEAMTLGQTDFEGVALRYGFFYGPGTWFTPDGDVGEQVLHQQVPIIGAGQGVSSWVHIEDAADATARALECAPGAYNIVDDYPSEQRVWLTAFARYCGAPEPPRVSEQQALEAAGPDAVYYATRLRGASNAKAKRELGFRPRRLEWLMDQKG